MPGRSRLDAIHQTGQGGFRTPVRPHQVPGFLRGTHLPSGLGCEGNPRPQATASGSATAGTPRFPDPGLWKTRWPSPLVRTHHKSPGHEPPRARHPRAEWPRRSGRRRTVGPGRDQDSPRPQVDGLLIHDDAILGDHFHLVANGNAAVLPLLKGWDRGLRHGPGMISQEPRSDFKADSPGRGYP